jgi:hypothetical protein
MQECQEKARDLIKPGSENDSYAMAKVEKALISCMDSQVKEHIKLLKPMKERCVSLLYCSVIVPFVCSFVCSHLQGCDFPLSST